MLMGALQQELRRMDLTQNIEQNTQTHTHDQLYL